MSTGFADAAVARQHLRQRSAASRRQLRQLEPGRLARVGAEDPEPARVREHADAATARQRLAREQRRPRRRAPRASARAARRPGRKSASTAASEPASAAVCELAALRAGRRRARLEREDRLAARDAARQAGELARGCRTTRGRAARRRCPGRPPTTRAGRSRRRPPCSRSRRRPRSRAALELCSSSARPSAPDCEEKPIRPGGQRTRREGRVQLRLRGGDPEAVRPEQARAVRADEREQLLLPLAPLRAGLGEAGRDHAERAHALGERLLGRLEHAPARERRSRRARPGRGSRRSSRSRARRRPARRRG